MPVWQLRFLCMKFIETDCNYEKRILLVDGYNMIAFWKETRQLFKINQLDEARETLLRKLNHYANFEHIDIICVFDAQFVPGNRQRYDQYRVSVIFTEEDETADSYIERSAAEMNTIQNLVEVATSDLNEQWGIFFSRSFTCFST